MFLLSFWLEYIFALLSQGRETQRAVRARSHAKGQPCPDRSRGDWRSTAPSAPLPCEGPALLGGFALTPLLRSSNTAGLRGKECSAPALPAGASSFCLGMRKLGTTFLYVTEPSWGLGTSTWVLLAVEYRDFLASTYLSFYHNPRWANIEARCVLSPRVQRHRDIN